MDGLVFYLIALGALLVLSAFFSGSEAALYSLTRPQIRALRNRSATGGIVARLLEKPRSLLVSILLGNLIVNVFATSTATAIMLSVFGERGLGYAFLIMAVLIMFFGEILPKSIAVHRSEGFAYLIIVPLRIFHLLVTPLRLVLSAATDVFINAANRRLGQPKIFFTSEELVTAAKLGTVGNAAAIFEYEVLTNILEFRDKIVKEIMTPSIHVVSRPAGSDRNELLEYFLESGLSRIPIHGDSPDEIIGILHIKDLVDPSAARTEKELRALLREPVYFPETAPIGELYEALQKRKAHIAVVIDEYASFVGVVTIEDILEELVGDIRDARDPKIAPFMRLDSRRIVVPGTMEIDEFNRVFNTRIVDDEHETVAGFVTGRTGRIPREGEIINAGGLRFHIISAQPNRIRKMRVEKP